MNSKTQISIVHAQWDEHRAAITSIRRSVFIEEQHVPEDEEWDDLDSTAMHFLAFDEITGAGIATARLLPQGKLTRMAVLKEWRSQGVGTQLLNFVFDRAKAEGTSSILLDAQIQAEPFYRQHGFSAFGEVFLDAGIEHVAMRKSLNSTNSVTRIQYTSDALEWLLAFSKNASRSIDIFSQWLTPGLYGHAQFVEHISALARKHANSQVRIIVRDTKPLQSASHPLVNLARRLPSSIEIRRYTEGASEPDSSFLCADRAHLVKLVDECAPAGFARANARAESRKLLEEFNYLWNYGSRSDPNLRILAL